MLEQLTLSAAWSLIYVPVIVGVVTAVKPFLDDRRWHAPVSIGVGIAMHIATAATIQPADIRLAVINGIVAGLAASGLYSVAGSARG